MDKNQERKERSIGLIGQGLIYQSVKRHLESKYHTVQLTMESPDQSFADCALVVYCSDTWSPNTLKKINSRLLQSGVALLPVYTQFEEGIIGPCVFPQEKGCTSCAELRKLSAIEADEDRELLRQYLFNQRDLDVYQPWLTLVSLETLALQATEEIATYLQRPDQLRTRNALLFISLENLNCSKHHFTPLSDCPDCGKHAEDTARMAEITLQSRPKPDPFTYRAQKLAPAEQILAEYVDPRAGMIQSVSVNDRSTIPIASAWLRVEKRDGAATMDSTGSTLRAEQSKIVAVLEALERYGGLRPRGKRAMVHASYNQLGSQALDPTTLRLHTPEQYAQPDFHFVPYHHDLEFNWVWGYSFKRQSPILVPERCAYYGLADKPDNPPIVYEVSSGCALGNNLEEAIFHGILEVAERDAFLLTWYAELSEPRLDPHSVTDPMTRLFIEQLEHRTGYTIHAFNITHDQAIPCICVIGVDEQNREGYAKARVVAGSHPHPEQALVRALRELAAVLSLPPQWYQEKREHALEMFEDTNKVRALGDHPVLYCLPEAFDWLGFLYNSPQPQQTFQETFRDFYQSDRQPLANMDLRDDLSSLISYYLRLGIDDIVVVDQTAPEYASQGFRSVKVLMPGMIPMTFGEQNRRTTGFQRLYQLPYILGYRSHPLTEADINPHPHPFS